MQVTGLFRQKLGIQCITDERAFSGLIVKPLVEIHLLSYICRRLRIKMVMIDEALSVYLTVCRTRGTFKSPK